MMRSVPVELVTTLLVFTPSNLNNPRQADVADVRCKHEFANLMLHGHAILTVEVGSIKPYWLIGLRMRSRTVL